MMSPSALPVLRSVAHRVVALLFIVGNRTSKDPQDWVMEAGISLDGTVSDGVNDTSQTVIWSISSVYIVTDPVVSVGAVTTILKVIWSIMLMPSLKTTSSV
jgi:hypothetical protein